MFSNALIHFIGWQEHKCIQRNPQRGDDTTRIYSIIENDASIVCCCGGKIKLWSLMTRYQTEWKIWQRKERKWENSIYSVIRTMPFVERRMLILCLMWLKKIFFFWFSFADAIGDLICISFNRFCGALILGYHLNLVAQTIMNNAI